MGFDVKKPKLKGIKNKTYKCAGDKETAGKKVMLNIHFIFVAEM
mgnify:FL=1